MPTIPIHLKCQTRLNEDIANPLPTLLNTPSGLAILELQGTINLPSNEPHYNDEQTDLQSESHAQTPIGRLVFPDYDASNPPSNGSWMKRVHLYVGRHQRLTGEVKKLPKPLAIIRRRQSKDSSGAGHIMRSAARDTSAHPDGNPSVEELEIAEIIRYRLLFSARPEPVS
ncbi:sister chromatid cohesion protein Ctf8 [Coccidioides immitis RS]|uniref:Sister chromatid cohesion protein Ctf8 n=1 Tax=Coccidioides immitis (strain RS) TaxID=246410 RepID=A0A0E1S509_COCIM|nr:sister chromatid cohesion protein Ctf8 [Coccidioides immitis RS]EAS36113.2 sister chromatid cohesion protein Ctf8 [Coccidioides immitis RS]TPX25727.1 hypothetical protein DIZ76_011184 [Coccidioides immitis]